MNKALSMIGLAVRAGKVKSGEFSVENEVKGHKACLVIIAGDASENTGKKFRNMCEFHKVPYLVCSDKETLGHAMGLQERAVLAVMDRGFADRIQVLLETEIMEDRGK